MKHWLKFCRFSLVLLIALTVALSAAVGVSAETLLLDKYEYIAQDSFGIIYLSTVPLSVYPVSTSNNADAAINPDRILWYGYTNNNFDMLVLIPYIIGSVVYYTPINIDDNNAPYMILPYDYTYKVETAENYYFYGVSGASNPVGYANVAIAINRWYSSYNAIVENYKITSNYNISNYTVSGNPSNYRIPINNITIDSNFNINNALNNDISISELSTIIQTIINNQTNSLLQIGNNYNQIEQNLINNLGSAEDQLSSAEGALEDKSKSLIQQASAGISKATTASQTLVTSLTTTIPTVYTFASDIIEVTPPEVQAAVLAIPLLSFAVWLIGLRR